VTKIRKQGDSSMIDDRRGAGAGGASGGFGRGGFGGGGMPFPMKAGGGLIGVVVMLAIVLLPRLLSGGGFTPAPSGGLSPGLDTPSGGSGDGVECSTELEQIVCGGVEDVQTFWIGQFEAAGRDYPQAQTALFTGSVETGCGTASSSTGPFYCPADSTVYFDVDFLAQLQEEFGATGDLAAQYIVAHEYGHHVQNVLGISSQVRELEQQNPSQANAYSVRLELQADCLAGVWAHDAAARGQFDFDAEVQEALNAAAAVGDDRIQQQTQGRVDPHSFTHGTSEQRATWFRRGFDSGSSDSCDTFAE
jgi:uncharacterized protein